MEPPKVLLLGLMSVQKSFSDATQRTEEILQHQVDAKEHYYYTKGWDLDQ